MNKSIKEKLIRMRDQLLEEILENIKMESDTLKSEIGDLYDLADEERNRQLSLLLSNRDRRKLIDIEGAIQRIEEDTYGFCEECGDKISPERLKIMPFAHLCVDCQFVLEKETERLKRLEGEGIYREDSSFGLEEGED